VPVRRTATRLADGRELIYFDDSEPFLSGAATRRLDDPRPLPDRFADVVADDGATRPVTAPQMRYDVLTGEWVPMAAHRMHRTHLPPADANPLAPARPGADYSDGEIPATDYDVVVFENRFPSLLRIPDQPDEVEYVDGESLWPTRPAAGRAEVICFSPDPAGSLASVSPRRMRTVIEAWVDRTRELSALPGVEQVFCFENRGKEIGVTLHHPHGQIYAYPYIPPRVERMLSAARRHREARGSCIGCDLLADELANGTRIVAQNDAGVAYVPQAARWPFEVHVVPRRHVADLVGLPASEGDALLLLQAEVLTRLDAIFDEPVPYMAGWIGSPNGDDNNLLHLRLQMVSPRRSPGKLKYLGSSEALMGAFINDVRPEEAAERLRGARGRIG
jgi:UDPglucose--hexose-1-phosphate uridylyltransferase